MSAEVVVERIDANGVDDLLPLFLDYLRFYERTIDAEVARAFLQARLQQRQSVVFLARLGSGAIGFVQLYPAFASLSLAPSWILNDLYVAENARGRGAARALMEAARGLALTNGAAEIFLQTARDNTPAQTLYEGLGYARDDAFLVYTLSLPRP
ncbi:GNAT family N-acetyltransferase [Arenimonas sp.]|uniref:GNAT family N-acetyltransferase n=1 Tax=Arenimonas sp. TaxID=1872635 RepID=UPI0039E53143